MSIGIRIKQARLASGISQTRLAELLGITRSACSQWESTEGGTIPRSARLAELADLLGVNFAWLMTGNEDSAAGIESAISHEHVSATDQQLRPLTREQKELINLYGRLSPKGRAALLLLLRNVVQARQRQGS